APAARGRAARRGDGVRGLARGRGEGPGLPTRGVRRQLHVLDRLEQRPRGVPRRAGSARHGARDRVASHDAASPLRAPGVWRRRRCFLLGSDDVAGDPCGDEAGPLPYDLDAAARLLDAAGWARGPRGRHDANGTRFHFELITSALMADAPTVAALRAAVASLG